MGEIKPNWGGLVLRDRKREDNWFLCLLLFILPLKIMSCSGQTISVPC